jgi:hypothetical protein
MFTHLNLRKISESFLDSSWVLFHVGIQYSMWSVFPRVWNLPSVESFEKIRKILVVTVSSVTAYISEELTANRIV